MFLHKNISKLKETVTQDVLWFSPRPTLEFFSCFVGTLVPFWILLHFGEFFYSLCVRSAGWVLQRLDALGVFGSATLIHWTGFSLVGDTEAIRATKLQEAQIEGWSIHIWAGSNGARFATYINPKPSRHNSILTANSVSFGGNSQASGAGGATTLLEASWFICIKAPWEGMWLQSEPPMAPLLEDKSFRLSISEFGWTFLDRFFTRTICWKHPSKMSAIMAGQTTPPNVPPRDKAFLRAS